MESRHPLSSVSPGLRPDYKSLDGHPVTRASKSGMRTTFHKPQPYLSTQMPVISDRNS